jgi:hypothetical protein
MITFDPMTTKVPFPENVLERLPVSASFYQFPQRSQLILTQRPVKLDIQLQSLQSQHMSQHVLHIQAWGFYPLLFQKGGTTLQDLEHRLHAKSPATALSLMQGEIISGAGGISEWAAISVAPRFWVEGRPFCWSMRRYHERTAPRLRI